MQTAEGSPLVAGAAHSAMTTKTISIRAVRSFMFDGKSVAVDAVIDVPVNRGQELIAMNKAVASTFSTAESAAYTESIAQADVTEPEAPRRGRPPKSKE